LHELMLTKSGGEIYRAETDMQVTFHYGHNPS